MAPRAAKINPIRLHPDNPHYFEFRGRPTVLLTSAEHYAAVLNLDFDYVAYLDMLARYDLNYTRIYPGAYFETDGFFCKDNPLGPREGRHILPWARSATPGYVLGGNIFDLDAWDSAYFTRLRDFAQAASDRGVVIEVCFFNCMYPDIWPFMPLNAKNNIQGVGTLTHIEFQTLQDARLVGYQDAYVRKITDELSDFDNIIFEIVDEPLNYGTDERRVAYWTSHMIEIVRDAQAGLPHRHLIAQQVIGLVGGPHDFAWDDRVDIATGQYVGRTWGGQMGGIELLETHYRANKPIELNETSYYPYWYEPEDMHGAVRAEAWEFIVGGGGGYNNLNGYFNNVDSAGDVPDNHKILGQLKILKDFIEGFDFLRMEPIFLTREVPDDTFARCIAEPGQQYAMYVHHSKLVSQQRYVPSHGKWISPFAIALPAGDYAVEWVAPDTGKVTATERLSHLGGLWKFETPEHVFDIALRMRRVE